MLVPLLRRVLPARPTPRRSPARPALEQLETRLVPSLTRFPPILVNPGNPAQGTDPNPSAESSFAPPNVAVAEDAAGDFVEVWFSTANGNEVLAQRFSPTGTPIGATITIVSNYSPATQNPIPAVGMDSAGDFVVAFDSVSGVFASRFDAAGNSLDATPFQVDTVSGGFENSNPSVALDDQGRFVISYVGFNSSGADVIAQRGFISGPSPLNGGPLTVASQSFFSGFYQTASVSVDSAGDFVVAYEPFFFSGPGGSAVLAQIFDPSGNAVGSPITLSNSGVATAPSVALNRASGTFAVTWVEATSTPVLMAETFAVDGTPLAGPFAVSPAGDPPSTQLYDTPAVAADSAGDFVAVWAVHGVSDETAPGIGLAAQALQPNNSPPPPQMNDPDPTGDVFSQTFDVAGNLTGPTIQITTQQNAPGPTGVAMDAAGDYVVTFSAAEQTAVTPNGPTAIGNQYDVIAVIFRSVSAPSTVVPPTVTPPTVVPPQANPLSPALAIALLSGENEDPPPPETLIIPTLEESIDVVSIPRAIPAVPADRLNPAVALVRQVGGTVSVGAISGKLFSDLNGDGTFEPGKPPLAGRLVFLDINGNGVLDEGEPVTVTNSNGEYSFTNLSLRTYQVRQVLPGSDVQTLPPENGGYEVRLDNVRHDVGGRDFGSLFAQRRAAPAPMRVAPPPPPPSSSGTPPSNSDDGDSDDVND
jgi:hypothetical protein